MGNSLHNKIYLGRHARLGSWRMQAALALGACAAIGLVWLALRVLR